jgi:hypothetical protein
VVLHTWPEIAVLATVVLALTGTVYRAVIRTRSGDLNRRFGVVAVLTVALLTVALLTAALVALLLWSDPG